MSSPKHDGFFVMIIRRQLPWFNPNAVVEKSLALCEMPSYLA